MTTTRRAFASSRRFLLLISALVVSAVAVPVSSAPAEASSLSSSLPRFSHVVVIVMENHEYNKIIGSSQASYINALARNGSLATSYFAIGHPSLPNYLALTAGSTFGITSDCTSCSVSAFNLGDQLSRAGITWKAYMQGMPSPCYKGVSFGNSPQQYVKRHDPFMYFSDIRNNSAVCQRHVKPFSSLRLALSRNALPRFAFVVPTLCNDMHSCSVGTGDRFLSTLVPQIRRHLGRSGIVVLTWDEGSSGLGCCGNLAAGGHVATIVVGPGSANVNSSVAYDHYSLVGTIERAWGLHLMRNAACSCTASMWAMVG